MKKTIVLVLAACMVIAALAACGNDKEKTSSSEGSESTEANAEDKAAADKVAALIDAIFASTPPRPDPACPAAGVSCRRGLWAQAAQTPGIGFPMPRQPAFRRVFFRPDFFPNATDMKCPPPSPSPTSPRSARMSSSCPSSPTVTASVSSRPGSPTPSVSVKPLI